MNWLHYITLETIYSGLSKSNFKDHYGDAATEQCLGMIAEINEFSVSDEMLRVMGQTGRRQVSRAETRKNRLTQGKNNERKNKRKSITQTSVNTIDSN